MNPDNFTDKTNETLVAVHKAASKAGHAHVLDGNASAGDFFERVPNGALKKRSSQSPSLDNESVSTELIKAIRRMQTVQMKCSNTHMPIDQLLRGLHKDAQITCCLKEAGVSSYRMRYKLEKLRARRRRWAQGGVRLRQL
jgi:hypothetical protein